MMTVDIRRCATFNVERLLVFSEQSERNLTLPRLWLTSVTYKGLVTLSLEDVQDDIKRLIGSLAFRYTDQSCVFLHTEEIEAELHAKFSAAMPTAFRKAGQSRSRFFAYAKTVLANCARSLVQKHRFTQKRTGVKPPPKHERGSADFRSYKPNEISLDDPDAYLQVGDESVVESDHAVNELVQDILERCDETHQVVFRQLTRPNLTALRMAELDARRGKEAHRASITITRRNMADGIGMMIEQFEKCVLHIREITIRVRAMKPDDLKYDAALATLCLLFGLQVPKTAPDLVIRRCLTLAARDNWQKVNSEVEDLLECVGAKAPKFNNTTMSCLGVLYQQTNRICQSCGLKDSCKVQAANIGLGEISLSPKLLGAKLNRVPYILPNPSRTMPPDAANVRDMEIIDYLFANFRRVTHKGELYFQPKEFISKQKLIFCIGTSTIPLNLRFRSPGPAIRKQLAQRGSQYYAPAHLTSEQVIELINEHTKDAYDVVTGAV